MAADTKVVLENLVDGYVAESKSIKGSMVVAATANEMNALAVGPTKTALVVGSLCYVSGEGKYYQWNGSAWAEASIATSSTLADYAKDADVVKLTGDQTIAGAKTFSSGVDAPSIGSASSESKISLSDATGIVPMEAAKGWRAISSSSLNVSDPVSVALEAGEVETSSGYHYPEFIAGWANPAYFASIGATEKAAGAFIGYFDKSSGDAEIKPFIPTEDAHATTKKYVDGEIAIVTKIAEGKTRAIVVDSSLDILNVKTYISTEGYKVYSEDGTDITSAVANGDYDDMLKNSDLNVAQKETGGSIVLKATDYLASPSGDKSFLFTKVSSLKAGDIVYTISTSIFDWWVGSVSSEDATLYPFDAEKPDLSGYATQSWVTGKGYLVSSDLDSKITATPSLTSGTSIGSVSVNGTTKTFYAPSVSATASLTSGTKVGTVTVGSSTTTFYAPSSPDLSSYATQTWVTNKGYLTASDLPSKVTYSATVTTGTAIGTLNVNGTSTTLYAPEGGSGSEVESVKTQETGGASSISLKFWKGTQEQYDSITDKDSTTLYVVAPETLATVGDVTVDGTTISFEPVENATS